MQRSAALSNLMAQRPMARTAFLTKSTSTSVAYSLNSSRTCKRVHQSKLKVKLWTKKTNYKCTRSSPKRERKRKKSILGLYFGLKQVLSWFLVSPSSHKLGHCTCRKKPENRRKSFWSRTSQIQHDQTWSTSGNFKWIYIFQLVDIIMSIYLNFMCKDCRPSLYN